MRKAPETAYHSYQKSSQCSTASIHSNLTKYNTKHPSGCFFYKNIDTKKIEEISFSDESSGTRKLITLYTYIHNALENGATIFIDEMDAKLHPLLTRQLINLFHSEDTNPNNAQLIFTTHDTNTLTNELFRRDQIWFSEKDENGISSLYSLAEYKINETKVRKDSSYNKNYLGGRYGAIPNLNIDKAGE